MPVTAKLSKNFYDRLGEQIANELVEWFNQVDATYRSDLREVNELNFSRFDARVGERFADSELRIERRMAAFEDKIERRIGAFEDKMERRIGALEDKMELRIGALEQRVTTLEGRMEVGFEALRTEMARGFERQNRFLLSVLTVQFAAILGLYLR